MKLVKEGLRIGDFNVIEVVVTKEMFAQFGAEVVHPTYSTASMVYHMEWASRDLMLPYLEESAESAGAAVTVKHIAPSALGSNIEVKAVAANISEQEVITEVTATNETGLIGKGKVKQVVLPKHTMQTNLDNNSR